MEGCQPAGVLRRGVSDVLETLCDQPAHLAPPPGALQGPHLCFGLQMFRPETTKPWKPPAFWAQGWGAAGTSNSLAPTWMWEHWVTPGVATLGLGSLEGLDKRARKGLLGGKTGRKLPNTEHPFYVRPLRSELLLQSFGMGVSHPRVRTMKIKKNPPYPFNGAYCSPHPSTPRLPRRYSLPLQICPSCTAHIH